MAITLDMSAEDARFLADHLARHMVSLDDELIHTDSHEIQHQLALEVDRLRRILERLSTSIR